MPVYRWSQVAANNGTADINCPWPEGMAPSAVNDSARGTMAAVAMFRDDIAGAIVTAGSPTAYTVASYSQFNSLTSLNGQVIAFTPHTTNGAGPVTLNVDGLGTKPLRSAPGADLLAGVLIQGTPYTAVYNNVDGAFYLHSFYGNPYNVPLGAGLDYWLPTAPNSSFAFPYGQAISRATYATLFAQMGTTYGAGDGSTTFNLPDKRGRVTACPDNMGGADAGRLNNSASNISSGRLSLGGAGGEVAHTLTTAEMPAHNHTATSTDSGHTHPYTAPGSPAAGQTSGGSFAAVVSNNGSNTGTSYANITTTIANNGGGGAHNVVQPTILCNYILRII